MSKPYNFKERKYQNKRSVKHDLPPWNGWDELLYLYSKAEDTKFPEESKLYFAVYFETGCRVSEGLQLTPDQFRWNEYAIHVYTVPVLKRKERETRNILIKIEDNPLANELIDFIESCNTRYLLPKRRQFTRELVKNEHTSRSNVYRKINEIDSSLWVHGLRGLRASHLVAERGFDVFNLTRWFNWVSSDMAIHYAQSVDMAKVLDIPVIP
jgi:integrase